MENISNPDFKEIIDFVSDGVYVTNLDRRITYWNKAAERITGWRAEDIIGTRCHDNVLCHVDKDGHPLCGEEYCPLHRAIITGSTSEESVLVYAQGSDGQRIPVFVNVAPIRNASGEVIGGVETFQDARSTVHDLEQAKAIQDFALQSVASDDARVSFTTHYIPHGIVGGDYYAITRISDHHYALMLADVVGHGTAAALYTMYLSSLWDRYLYLLTRPAAFLEQVNGELKRSMKGDVSFATAVCGLIDLEKRVFRLAGAGGPEVLLTHPDGTYDCLQTPGPCLALMEDATYEEVCVDVREGDALLLFTDGAIEIWNAADEMLGVDGLVGILRKRGCFQSPIQMEVLEEELLRYSNTIRFDDDLTLINVRFNKW